MSLKLKTLSVFSSAMLAACASTSPQPTSSTSESASVAPTSVVVQNVVDKSTSPECQAAWEKYDRVMGGKLAKLRKREVERGVRNACGGPR
jgi:hypothetical protein